MQQQKLCKHHGIQKFRTSKALMQITLALARPGLTSVCHARAHEQHRAEATSPSRTWPPPAAAWTSCAAAAAPYHPKQDPCAPPLHLCQETHRRGDGKAPVAGSVESRALLTAASSTSPHKATVVVHPSSRTPPAFYYYGALARRRAAQVQNHHTLRKKSP